MKKNSWLNVTNMSSIQNLKSSHFNIKPNGLYIKGVKYPGILLIWANWCPHCHEFIPKYKEMCKQLGAEFICTALEHSEFKDDESLSSALDFKYFPTIKFFDQSGKLIGDYTGKRDISSVLDYICKMYHHCIFYH